EPEPAVPGGSKDQVVSAKEAESLSDVMGVERRDVAPDENSRRRGAVGERAAHPDTEIAPPLSGGFDPLAPEPGPTACIVGCHRDPQTPAPVLRETALQQQDHRPLEAKRCNVADLAREAAFAAAEQRCPHE